MLRALLCVLLWSGPVLAQSAGTESAPPPASPTTVPDEKPASIALPEAVRLTLLPLGLGAAAVASVTLTGAVLGAGILGGYAFSAGGTGPVPAYALGGFLVGGLLALPLALLGGLAADFVGFLVRSVRAVPVPESGARNHVLAALLPLAGVAFWAVVGGAATALVLISRVPQEGLQRDPVGTAVQAGLVMGAASIVALPVVVLAGTLGRAAVFWFLERRAHSP